MMTENKEGTNMLVGGSLDEKKEFTEDKINKRSRIQAVPVKTRRQWYELPYLKDHQYMMMYGNYIIAGE